MPLPTLDLAPTISVVATLQYNSATLDAIPTKCTLNSKAHATLPTCMISSDKKAPSYTEFMYPQKNDKYFSSVDKIYGLWINATFLF